jgi:hypothetical protein
VRDRSLHTKPSSHVFPLRRGRTPTARRIKKPIGFTSKLHSKSPRRGTSRKNRRPASERW